MRLVKYALKHKKAKPKRFGRKASKLELMYLRDMHDKLDYVSNMKYSEHASVNSPIYQENFMVFANHALVCGVTEDDYNLHDRVLTSMEKFKPECIVLGRMCYTDMEQLRHGNRVSFYPPIYEPISREQTMATMELDKFIRQDLETSPFFFDDVYEESSVFLADHKLKRKISQTELSLAKIFLEHKKRQFFFGAPNKLFVLEDICLNYSLDQLKEKFLDGIENYKSRNKEGLYVPQTEPADYKFNFRQWALKDHKMYSTEMMYTAAMTRKLLKLYKKVGLTCENHHAKKIRKYIEDPNLPEFDKIFHQDEYFSKLKSVLARDEDCEVLIEKLAILSYLHSDYFRSFLECGVNPLHQMFSSRYEYIPLEDLLVIFYEKLEPYQKIIKDSFFRQLTSLETYPSYGRDLIEPYKETISRINKKRHKDYEYPVDVLENQKSLMYSNCIIMKKIYEIIWEREQEGIDQTQTKIDLYEFFQKIPTRGNLIVFQQLFAEANAQLGLLRLPEDFIRHKELIYRQTYKMVKENTGKDERILEKEMMIAEQTNSLNKFYNPETIYSEVNLDGRVKPLDVIAKKEGKELISENEDLGHEEKEKLFNEWFDRHYKLEELRSKHPDKAAQIDQAQSSIKGGYKKDIKELEYVTNYKGEMIKKNDAEMNYMLFSKEGNKMPLNIKEATINGKTIKLPDKLTRNNLKELGFNDVGVVNIRKGQDGDYKAFIDEENKDEVNKTLEEVFGKQIQVQDELEASADVEDPEYPLSPQDIFKSINLTEEQIKNKEHADRMLQAFLNGEEYDHEEYYEILDRNPRMKRIAEQNKKLKKQRILKKLKDEKELSRLGKIVEENEKKHEKYLEDTRDHRTEQKVEETIDTLMKDEWSRIRIAQQMSKVTKIDEGQEKISSYLKETEAEIKKEFDDIL
ncbi:unnamed protein product [Moneuplotes crassus]|uniref:Uncharacterized protein n=2 Tax=Euplotes crassus TaxID=5936 RepID=A0AAD1UKL2_EUPCR|nr:unnamed protein product [Moneuplotes crassus]